MVGLASIQVQDFENQIKRNRKEMFGCMTMWAPQMLRVVIETAHVVMLNMGLVLLPIGF